MAQLLLKALRMSIRAFRRYVSLGALSLAIVAGPGLAAADVPAKPVPHAPANDNGQSKGEKSERSETKGAAFNEAEQAEYQEIDESSDKEEEYEGGVAIVIGSGVVLAALIVVLIVVLVD